MASWFMLGGRHRRRTDRTESHAQAVSFRLEIRSLRRIRSARSEGSQTWTARGWKRLLCSNVRFRIHERRGSISDFSTGVPWNPTAIYPDEFRLKRRNVSILPGGPSPKGARSSLEYSRTCTQYAVRMTMGIVGGSVFTSPLWEV